MLASDIFGLPTTRLECANNHTYESCTHSTWPTVAWLASAQARLGREPIRPYVNYYPTLPPLKRKKILTNPHASVPPAPSFSFCSRKSPYSPNDEGLRQISISSSSVTVFFVMLVIYSVASIMFVGDATFGPCTEGQLPKM